MEFKRVLRLDLVLAELVQKQSTGLVPVANGEHYTFTTHWVYDSWNRVQEITYPDGDVVSYGYDHGIQLNHMLSLQAGTLIENLEYDELGSRTSINYGNGTYANYGYDPTTRRLSTLESYDGNGDAIQHLQYLPFGEDFIHEQSTSSYHSPFTFSGKERDASPGLLQADSRIAPVHSNELAILQRHQ